MAQSNPKSNSSITIIRKNEIPTSTKLLKRSMMIKRLIEVEVPQSLKTIEKA
jgi:hypothetical protein